MTDLKSALFLDFEACSIHPESWPIEIGIARIESGQVLSDSRLIRPAPGWDLDLWSVVSESIHGISLERLQDEGEDVTRVADWFRALEPGSISPTIRHMSIWGSRMRRTAPQKMRRDWRGPFFTASKLRRAGRRPRPAESQRMIAGKRGRVRPARAVRKQS